MILREIARVIEQLKVAENRFNWASSVDEIDSAIYEMKSIETRLNMLFK